MRESVEYEDINLAVSNIVSLYLKSKSVVQIIWLLLREGVGMVGVIVVSRQGQNSSRHSRV